MEISISSLIIIITQRLIFTRIMGMERLRIFVSISGIKPAGDSHGSAWVDFDNDGDLDLSITKGARRGHAFGTKQDELYQNLGAGQFTNIAEAAGVTNTLGRGRSVAWGDYDNDGHLDLLLGNLKTDLALLKEQRGRDLPRYNGASWSWAASVYRMRLCRL